MKNSQLLRLSNYGTGSSPSGGAGSDLGVASNNTLGLFGQGRFFEEEAANSQEKLKNQQQRNRQRRKRLRRWRSLKNQNPL